MRLTSNDIALIGQVYIILSTELNKRITVADLIARVKLSEAKITQGFKQQYNSTIYHFHLLKRMEYARTLISSGMQVQEVADLLGYSEPAAFTRAFRRIYPNPPNHYRSEL